MPSRNAGLGGDFKGSIALEVDIVGSFHRSRFARKSHRRIVARVPPILLLHLQSLLHRRYEFTRVPNPPDGLVDELEAGLLRSSGSNTIHTSAKLAGIRRSASCEYIVSVIFLVMVSRIRRPGVSPMMPSTPKLVCAMRDRGVTSRCSFAHGRRKIVLARFRESVSQMQRGESAADHLAERAARIFSCSALTFAVDGYADDGVRENRMRSRDQPRFGRHRNSVSPVSVSASEDTGR